MSPTPSAFCRAALTSVLLLVPFAARAAADDDAVTVSVVAVLATDQNDKIDAKVECIAREVQKREPKLTGFRMAVMTTKPIPVGGKEDFDVGSEQKMRVVVEEKADKEGRYQLKISPPQMGDITYTTTPCGKFFPVMTPFRTRNKEWLIVSVSVQSCGDKDK